jgi:hypothetical protein
LRIQKGTGRERSGSGSLNLIVKLKKGQKEIFLNGDGGLKIERRESGAGISKV